MFIKYMHLERFGNDEVEGIEIGTTYVFPKLDGTNAQVWLGLEFKVDPATSAHCLPRLYPGRVVGYPKGFQTT
jgi:hypothetical protein